MFQRIVYCRNKSSWKNDEANDYLKGKVILKFRFVFILSTGIIVINRNELIILIDYNGFQLYEIFVE